MDSEIKASSGPAFSQEVFALLHNCELAVARTERQLLRAQVLASAIQDVNQNTAVQPNGGLYSTSKSKIPNKIMQDALASVMLERDETHSALVATRVIHVHELDQQRRKVGILESKLKFLEDSSNRDSAPAASFFLGQTTIPDITSMTRIEKQMVQSVDAELLALCRQLSSEISSRVSAELETIRLQESSIVAHAMELADRAALEEQLEFYKTKAEAESLRCEAAVQETNKWKQAFQRILQSDADEKQNGRIT